MNEKEDTLVFQRLRWNSPWMSLGGPMTIVGLWFLIHQIWNGFILLSTIFGLVFLAAGLPVVAACLQTVHIGHQEILLMSGRILLRRIPSEEIRTLAGVSIGIGRGGSCMQRLIILSARTVEEMTGSRTGDVRSKLNRYYADRIYLGFLPAKEGLWIYDSGECAVTIAAMLPKAENELS